MSRCLALLALLLTSVPFPAGATVLVPMRDEDLVATSDLIVIGVVTELHTVRLASARIVTRVTLGVERTLKGDPGGDSIVVTEAGGSVGGLSVVIPGAPEYTRGERALVFLRVRDDGSLRTTALALGKYTLGSEARRDLPVPDVRPAAAFEARVAALAGGQRGAAGDGRRGAGVAPPELGTAIDAFSFNTSTGGLPGRWFEADCGIPVAFSQANIEASIGQTGSDDAVAAGLAAWTGVAGTSLQLASGPATTPAPSLISQTYDGRNTIQFDDPFGEVPDIVGCTGVLAQGGFVSSVEARFGFQTTVGDRTFGRILEGDVTVNPNLGPSCLDAVDLAEVIGHELGHAIGFGHSSENRNEADPALLGALMYFSLHGDGRGATLAADDVAALTASYPADRVANGDLPRLACDIGLGILGVGCFNATIPAKPLTLVRNARTKVVAAANAATANKRRRLLKKARRFLLTAQKKAQTASGACKSQILVRLDHLVAETSAALQAVQ